MPEVLEEVAEDFQGLHSDALALGRQQLADHPASNIRRAITVQAHTEVRTRAKKRTRVRGLSTVTGQPNTLLFQLKLH